MKKIILGSLSLIFQNVVIASNSDILLECDRFEIRIAFLPEFDWYRSEYVEDLGMESCFIGNCFRDSIRHATFNACYERNSFNSREDLIRRYRENLYSPIIQFDNYKWKGSCLFTQPIFHFLELYHIINQDRYVLFGYREIDAKFVMHYKLFLPAKYNTQPELRSNIVKSIMKMKIKIINPNGKVHGLC